MTDASDSLSKCQSETYDDPDERPVRPPSALSARSSIDSDLGHLTDEYDWGDELGPPPEWVSKRVARNVMRRDGFSCLVCGSALREQLTVVRVIFQHDDCGRSAGELSWLKVCSLSQVADEGRNSLSNMMTLCHAHAIAYDRDIWRFSPSEQWRQDHIRRRTPGSESDIVSPKTDIACDLVVFRPDEMPPYNLNNSLRAYRPADAYPRTERVLRPESHTVRIDPGFAFVALMQLVGSAYWPPPDGALFELELACIAFRDAMNEFP